jgi:hypothetical protein
VFGWGGGFPAVGVWAVPRISCHKCLHGVPHFFMTVLGRSSRMQPNTCRGHPGCHQNARQREIRHTVQTLVARNPGTTQTPTAGNPQPHPNTYRRNPGHGPNTWGLQLSFRCKKKVRCVQYRSRSRLQRFASQPHGAQVNVSQHVCSMRVWRASLILQRHWECVFRIRSRSRLQRHASQSRGAQVKSTSMCAQCMLGVRRSSCKGAGCVLSLRSRSRLR